MSTLLACAANLDVEVRDRMTRYVQGYQISASFIH